MSLFHSTLSKQAITLMGVGLESTNLLYMVNVLTAIKYGYIVKNEDDDIPEAIRTILSSYKSQFAAIGYDISNIRSLINV